MLLKIYKPSQLLFSYVLPKITNLFSSLINQTMLVRLLDTVQIHKTLLKLILICMKNSKKVFLAFDKPISLFLNKQQLILNKNADLARLTGIIYFTNSILALQPWVRSHDITSTIISSVCKDLGLQKESKSSNRTHQSCYEN